MNEILQEVTILAPGGGVVEVWALTGGVTRTPFQFTHSWRVDYRRRRWTLAALVSTHTPRGV